MTPSPSNSVAQSVQLKPLFDSYPLFGLVPRGAGA